MLNRIDTTYLESQPIDDMTDTVKIPMLIA